MTEQSKIFNNCTNERLRPLAVFEFTPDNENITFTHEDLKKAEADGYTKGFNEGMDLGISQGELKASREINAMTQETLLQLDAHLKEIKELEREFSENFFSNILRVCCAVLQKSMPCFFQKNGKEEMEKLLHGVIGSFIVKVPIQIKVSEQLYANATESFQALCASYSETIDIIKTSEFSNGACEIQWEGGSAKWNLDSRYKEINSKLQDYLKTYIEQGEHYG